MDKKNLSALIAGVGIAGAFGYRVYSQYKLLKADKTGQKDAETNTEKTEKLSEEENSDFNVDSLFDEETKEVNEDEKGKENVVDEQYFDVRELFPHDGESHTEHRVYLNAGFEQNDILKALGAKYDTTKEQWYVPEGIGLDSFTQWIPNGESETKNESGHQEDDTDFQEKNKAYKELDPNDPDLWSEFTEEIKKEDQAPNTRND